MVCGLALGAVAAPGLAPQRARAQTESPAVSAAYDTVGRWLFDLYLSQSIRLTVANVTQTRPDAQAVLGPQMPAIAKVLDRHREDFERAMQPQLRAHFTPADVTAFAARLAKPPLDLDTATRSRLIAVDADFRRDGQKAIRALTFDLGTIVADALAAAPPNRQN
jgi:hypothetical protein